MPELESKDAWMALVRGISDDAYAGVSRQGIEEVMEDGESTSPRDTNCNNHLPTTVSFNLGSRRIPDLPCEHQHPPDASPNPDASGSFPNQE
jgi:hypothetical protein